MSLVGKFVCELEIHALPRNTIRFSKTKSPMSQTSVQNSSNQLKFIKVIGTAMAMALSRYGIKPLMARLRFSKEQVEFDDEKFTLILTGLEKDMFNHYKVFNATYQVVSKDLNQSLTVLTLEYEKLDDDLLYPYKYLDLMVFLTKDIDSHHK